MVNLTNKLVASVKPPRDKKYIRLWDSNISGFGLRVTDKGVKSFIFEGRQGLSKKTKQVKIGRVGEMSVAEARTNAAELSRKFRSGEYEKLAQKRQGDNSTTSAVERFEDIVTDEHREQIKTIVSLARELERPYVQRPRAGSRNIYNEAAAQLGIGHSCVKWLVSDMISKGDLVKKRSGRSDAALAVGVDKQQQ